MYRKKQCPLLPYKTYSYESLGLPICFKDEVAEHGRMTFAYCIEYECAAYVDCECKMFMGNKEHPWENA